MPRITTFAEARKALEPFWPSHKRVHLGTLEHVYDFMDFLDNPQDKLKVVHVAGTSGKTSTAYYTAALLHAAGHKVGLTVSPHVDEINERVQINMVPLPEKQFCEQLGAFLDLVEESGIELSYFELLYTFAYWHFVQAKVEYIVVEVGVGGLLDSTNVITRADKICVITDIGLDHINILGSTLREIATHKAGIIQLHNPVFCYQQDPVIMEVIRETAEHQQADLHILDKDDMATDFDFLPPFQQRNLGLARAAAQWALRRDHDKYLTASALKMAAHTRIPGRMETFKRSGKTIVVDAAHNAQKLEALGRGLHAQYGRKPRVALVSMAAGRDYRLDEAAREMVAMAEHVIVTTFSGPQDGPHHSVEAEALEKALKGQGARSVEIIERPEAAFQAMLERPEKVAVITGSFYLLNHIRPLLRF